MKNSRNDYLNDLLLSFKLIVFASSTSKIIYDVYLLKINNINNKINKKVVM